MVAAILCSHLALKKHSSFSPASNSKGSSTKAPWPLAKAKRTVAFTFFSTAFAVCLFSIASCCGAAFYNRNRSQGPRLPSKDYPSLGWISRELGEVRPSFENKFQHQLHNGFSIIENTLVIKGMHRIRSIFDTLNTIQISAKLYKIFLFTFRIQLTVTGQMHCKCNYHCLKLLKLSFKVFKLFCEKISTFNSCQYYFEKDFRSSLVIEHCRQ